MPSIAMKSALGYFSKEKRPVGILENPNDYEIWEVRGNSSPFHEEISQLLFCGECGTELEKPADIYRYGFNEKNGKPKYYMVCPNTQCVMSDPCVTGHLASGYPTEEHHTCFFGRGRRGTTFHYSCERCGENYNSYVSPDP